MKILENYSLEKINAFKLDVLTKYFVEISNVDDLKNLILEKPCLLKNSYVLGLGWNTFFIKNFNGIVIKISIKSRKIISENSEALVLELGAGEDWIDTVKYAVNMGWSGIENLSLIPGTVGAAPVQNIAAYGQNFDEVFDSLEAIQIKTGKLKIFTKEECVFGYRSSIFKNKLKGKYIIIKVRIKLSKNCHVDTSYHSRYGSLKEELSKFAKPPYLISDIAKAVINIRLTKFPDWKKVGTAGSFFLNPVITKVELSKLQKNVPGVQFYPVDKLTYLQPDDPLFNYSDYVKVAAGWLLEELGWKGKKIDQVGTSPNQSLVIINYGTKNPQDIIKFSNKIQNDFKSHYKIELEPEVNFV